MKSLHIIVVLVGLLYAECGQLQPTPNLEEIFIGRCWDYQNVINPEPFINSTKNCTDLWEKFSAAFLYKLPCDVTEEDYRPFSEAANHTVNPHTSLFWEQVYPFVDEFSNGGKRYNTISDSLWGHMADDVYWCGQEGAPGYNSQVCPDHSDCQSQGGNGNEEVYWAMTSQYFSTETTGVAHVMLNGSVSPSYYPNSIFATKELVNLTPQKGVDTLDIWVVHDLSGPQLEFCGSGSILDLENIALNQGLQVACVNDPEQVRLYQCVDNPGAPQCQLV